MGNLRRPLKPYLIISIGLGLGFIAHAHMGQKPINPAGNIGDLISKSHGGYGYAASSSEAEADAAVDFDCAVKDQQVYANACGPREPAVKSAEEVLKLAKDYQAGTALKKLQEQVYDYSLLQAAAMNTTRPIDVPRPTCMPQPAGQPVSQSAQVPATPYTADQLEQLKKKIEITTDQAEKKKLQDRFNANYKFFLVSNSASQDNLVQAVALYDQLVAAKTANGCVNSQPLSMACLDLNDNIDRVKVGFPIVFGSGEQAARLESIRKDAQMLIGASFTKSADSAQILAKGKAKWSFRVKSQDWDAMQEFKREYTEARDLASVGEQKLGPDGRPTGAMVPRATAVSAQKQLAGTTWKMKQDFAVRLKSEMNGVCSMDFAALAKKYPSALRQLLLEESGSDLAGTKLAVCNSGDLKNLLTRSRDRSCSGITGKLNSGDGTVKIARYMPSFPFSSSQNYKVKKNADGSMTVALDIHFTKTGTPPMTAEEFKTKMAAFKTSADGFYNKGTENAKPPFDPKVKFAVNVIEGSVEPVFNFSKCYNRTLPYEKQHDCAAVKAAGGNWQDAGNLTSDTDANTVNHEFGHIMGLDDEYEADYYPMNLLGEHDSVMNDGSQLYRRHIKNILQPALRCGK
jgi:hypothetical protein